MCLFLRKRYCSRPTQSLEDPQSLARDIPVLVLMDHPTGTVHQLRVSVEGKGNPHRHAGGGTEGDQRCARQGVEAGFLRMRGPRLQTTRR